MKYQFVNISNKLFLCFVLFFLVLISASVAHAENYQFVTKWGSLGNFNGQFRYPTDVAVDSSANVYVADKNNHRIQKFNSNGGFITKWGSSGSGDGQFSYPHGVAVDSSANVYVTDYNNNRIQKFNSSGGFITKWGSSGSGDGQFSHPENVVVDSSGNVYVADTFNNRIQKFNSSGGFLTKWGSYGTESGQFSAPWGVAFDSSGNVYVADYNNNRIQKFDSTGSFITKWGSTGAGNGQFNYPSGVTVDSSGNIYVSDSANNRIQKFDSSGGFISTWGSSGADNGQFDDPTGVAVDSSGTVYISDTINQRIQKFAQINPVLPVANFSSNVTGGYAPLTVQFIDFSENATTWIWNFGDGNNSTEQNPIHIYSLAGNYTVNLTSSNGNGTNSTFTSIKVSEQPAPSYTLDKTVTDVTGKGPSGSVSKAGDVITYQVKLTNDGNIDLKNTDLTNVTLTDSLTDLIDPIQSKNDDLVLEIGEYVTYTGKYTVTQADIDNSGGGDGFINNTATIDSDLLGPKSKSANVLIDIADAGTYAYITNGGSNTVSVINTATDTITAVVSVGSTPYGVAVSPDGTKVYVANRGSNTVSVIDTATNNVTATVPVGNTPEGAAVSPDGTKLFVANLNSTTVSVINTTTNTVIATVPVGNNPSGVAVNPSGTKVYVTNTQSNTVSVIDTATNTVVATVDAGTYPFGVAVSPDGSKVYVPNLNSNSVSVINTSTDAVTASINVGSYPVEIAVNPDGTKVYVANYLGNSVSVINTATNTVESTISVGINPVGVTVSLDGTKVYVANYLSNSVSVIDAATNTVKSTVNVGINPIAYGRFIVEKPREPVLPAVNFSSNVTSGYVPLSVQFNDSSKNATEVNWDFDNDGTPDSTERNPVYSYATPGNYTVNLTAINGNGTNSTFVGITVLQKPVFPVASFSSNATKGYAPLSVQFTDLSENATGWLWDFGDGFNSTAENPVHIYSGAGNYTVNLTASNGKGTDSKLATIIVFEQNPAYTIDKIVTDVSYRGSEANAATSEDVISYRIDVVNNGNIDLTNVSVNDSLIELTEPFEYRPQLPAELPQSKQTLQFSQEEGDGILEVGEIWIYFGNYTVNQSDLNSNGGGDGFINNTATVVCDQLDQENDSADVSVEQKLDYSVYKSVIEVDNGGDCIVDDAGDIIRYRVVVKNEGNVDITNVSVNDTLTSLTGPAGDDVNPGVLNPGELWKFYGNYTVTQGDINSNGGGDGDIDNTAAVTCSKLPNKTSSISQPISQDAYLRIYKSAIGVDNAGDCIANEAGDVIEYQIAVKNDGKVDLTDVSVSDPMISLIGPVESKSADEVLTAGELWTYKGNYTVTQEDIDSNGGGDEDIDNTAIVHCNELPNATSSIEVPLVINKALREGTDSESNNTTDDTEDTSEDNSSSDDKSNDNSSHSSSGGSGGASPSPESSKNIKMKEISQAFVSSGNSVKFSFPKNVTSVTSITFDAKKTAGKTTTIVEMLKGKSTLVSELPSGEVYKSLNIWVGNGGYGNDKANLENAVIGFKVEKSWMQDKGIDSSSIILNRYSDKKWNELPTSFSGEDDKYLYFTAKSPGFSPFAVTAKTAAVQESGTEMQPESGAEDVQENSGSTEENFEQQNEKEGNTSKEENAPGFEMILGVAGLLGVFLYKKR